jgi:hypothetical protein
MMSRFTKEPKHSYDKAIDPDLDSKIRGWGPACLWLLVETFKGHNGVPLEDCESVLQSNAEIRKGRASETVYRVQSPN